MKWNNRIEQGKLKKEQSLESTKYRLAGMTEEQIFAIQEYDRQRLLRKRRETENGFEETTYIQVQPDGTEYIIGHPAMQNEENIIAEKPFHYGFSDDRLNKILSRADETDLEILCLLSKGFNQSEISIRLGLNQSNISRRIKKMAKK